MPKIYLDIDGVLLTKRHPAPAPGAEQLLLFALQHFECYWLTTHCKGNPQTVFSYLRPYFKPEMIEILQAVQPTNWDSMKTDAIDMTSDFYWLEDSPMQAEKAFLRKNDKMDRLIVVDLGNPDELSNIILHLTNAVKQRSSLPFL